MYRIFPDINCNATGYNKGQTGSVYLYRNFMLADISTPVHTVECNYVNVIFFSPNKSI